MERGDIITLVAGIAFVIIIAMFVKVWAPGSPQVQNIPIQNVPNMTPLIPAIITTNPSPGVTTATIRTTEPALPNPIRIIYTRNPMALPVIHLPDSMETFGGSDIPWKNPDVVIFAYMNESQGGLSGKFNVPYELWGMNISVEAWTKPQYAQFEMVLCTAEDGNILEGIEIMNGGTAFRNVQVSGRDMYLIIHTQNVDRFRIDFITPRAYYTRTQKTISIVKS